MPAAAEHEMAHVHKLICEDKKEMGSIFHRVVQVLVRGRFTTKCTSEASAEAGAWLMKHEEDRYISQVFG